MTDRFSEFGTSAALPLEEGDSTHKTAGDMLREAREAHGLHIEMVAAALKVPPQKLMALEANDIDSLPDAVFARALASSVCRVLRIDPAPVLAKLPGAQRAPLAAAGRAIKTNHIMSGAPRWNGGRSNGLPSRALLTVVVLLLIGAGALFWLPQSVFDQIGASVSRLTSRGEAEAGPVSGPPAAGAAAGESSVVAETVPTQAVAPGAASGGDAPAANANAAAAPAAAASSSVPAPAQAANGNRQLVFVAREECWITVTEAGGKQLLRRSLRAGETVGLSGTLPLSVVVGRASSVEVQVRGKPYDLRPVTRAGGIARFEVTS